MRHWLEAERSYKNVHKYRLVEDEDSFRNSLQLEPVMFVENRPRLAKRTLGI